MKNKKYVELDVRGGRLLDLMRRGRSKRVGSWGYTKMLLFKIPWDNFMIIFLA